MAGRVRIVILQLKKNGLFHPGVARLLEVLKVVSFCGEAPLPSGHFLVFLLIHLHKVLTRQYKPEYLFIFNSKIKKLLEIISKL